MAETGLTRFPIVDRERRRLVGMIALFDLLEARARNLEAERRRERILAVRRWRRRKTVEPPTDRRAAAPSSQA
jgi:CBS domain-containing protein